ncbi:MAG: ABC transporter substrate-binding protein, partial [Dehalococcoidia bacterium]|nr:ABC transporter substrate-binding protein [Dehalococcoidia bacterium]
MSEENFWDKFNEGQLDRRTFIKVASLLGGAAVFGLPLLGCQPAAPKQVFEMKLAVANPLIHDSPIYSGVARNFFAQEGINSPRTEFAGGPDQVRAVLTGGYPLGSVSTTSAWTAAEQGEPVRYIAGGFAGSLTGFLVKADSSFKKPEDLKTKKFKMGYSRPNSVSHMQSYLGLKAIGIDPNDKNQVELVATGGIPDSWTATKGGVVDLGWSNEPTMTQLEAKGEGRILDMWWDKDLFAVGIMTSQEFIDSIPDKLKA